MKMKKRFLSILLSLVMVLGLMPGMSLTALADGTYSGGTGTEADPYLISTVDDWKALAAAVNGGEAYESKYFRQTANLDMSEAGNLEPVGTLTAPFAGNYEGDGFAISNAIITGVTSTVQGYNMNVAGVFGALVGGGSISNLRVTNVTVTVTSGDGSWDQAYAGGLVAFAEDCTVTDCSVSGSTITADGSNIFAGALAGFAGAEDNEITEFSRCTSEGNTANTADYGGGFIGAIVNDASDDSIIFIDCYSANNTADAGTHTYGTVGGFLGGSQGGNVTAQNCFVYGCNATATGTGAKKGLFTGDTYYGTVNAINCYCYDTQNLPVNAESATSKTADEMKSLASTMGDAFAQGIDYPILLHPLNLEVSIEGWTYGETAKEPSVARNSSGEVIYTYAVKGTIDYSTTVPTNAGDYTVKATVAETSTHQLGEATADFTIAKATASVSKAPTAEDLTYNEKTQELVTPGEAKGGAMQYALGDADGPTEAYSASIPTATDAGKYYVWYKVVGDENHTDSAPASIPVTIAKADITPSVSIEGWEEESNSNTPSVSGNPGDGKVTYLYKLKDADDSAYSPEVPTEPGVYTVKAIVPETDNYNAGEAEQDFSITKKIDPSHVHSLTKTEAVPAACETEGTEAYWTCSDCHKMFSDEQGSQEITKPVAIPATGHDWGDWTVTTPANCEEDGEETRTCKNDDSHVETRTIPALGHDWGEWIVTVEPTLSQDGERYRVCQRDDSHVQMDVIPNLSYDRLSGDHSLTDPRFPADGETPAEPQDDPAPVDPADPAHDCPSAPYTDVDTSLWYHEAIDYVIENGLMNGFSDTEFRPDGTLSRAMLATILYRLDGSPAVSGENPFTDVEEDAWYTDAVIWASENGIVEGYGNNDFRPAKDVSRQEMAAMMQRYAEYKGIDTSAAADLSEFVDVDQLADWAVASMEWANSTGLIQGKNGKRLDPTGNTTRAQAATILMRFCENILK